MSDPGSRSGKLGTSLSLNQDCFVEVDWPDEEAMKKYRDQIEDESSTNEKITLDALLDKFVVFRQSPHGGDLTKSQADAYVARVSH